MINSRHQVIENIKINIIQFKNLSRFNNQHNKQQIAILY